MCNDTLLFFYNKDFIAIQFTSNTYIYITSMICLITMQNFTIKNKKNIEKLS